MVCNKFLFYFVLFLKKEETFFIKTNYKWAEFDKNIQKSPTYNV